MQYAALKARLPLALSIWNVFIVLVFPLNFLSFSLSALLNICL